MEAEVFPVAQNRDLSRCLILGVQPRVTVTPTIARPLEANGVQGRA